MYSSYWRGIVFQSFLLKRPLHTPCRLCLCVDMLADAPLTPNQLSQRKTPGKYPGVYLRRVALSLLCFHRFNRNVYFHFVTDEGGKLAEIVIRSADCSGRVKSSPRLIRHRMLTHLV